MCASVHLHTRASERASECVRFYKSVGFLYVPAHTPSAQLPPLLSNKLCLSMYGFYGVADF